MDPELLRIFSNQSITINTERHGMTGSTLVNPHSSSLKSLSIIRSYGNLNLKKSYLNAEDDTSDPTTHHDSRIQ